MNYCAESKTVGSSRNENPGSIHIDPGSFLIGICI